MRFFALIVGVLVLYLSILPCCTGEDICKDGEENILEASDMAEDSDLEFPCSPFLSCGSCAGFNLEKQLALKFDPLLISFRADEVFFSMCQSNGYLFLLIKPPVLASA